MILWTMVMAALSRSRRAFVNDGSLGAKSEKATDLKNMVKTWLVVAFGSHEKNLIENSRWPSEICVMTVW